MLVAIPGIGVAVLVDHGSEEMAQSHCLRVDGVQLQRCAALAFEVLGVMASDALSDGCPGALRGGGTLRAPLHLVYAVVIETRPLHSRKRAAQFASAFTLAWIPKREPARWRIAHR